MTAGQLMGVLKSVDPNTELFLADYEELKGVLKVDHCHKTGKLEGYYAMRAILA